jgi:hypothetical protein
MCINGVPTLRTCCRQVTCSHMNSRPRLQSTSRASTGQKLKELLHDVCCCRTVGTPCQHDPSGHQSEPGTMKDNPAPRGHDNPFNLKSITSQPNPSMHHHSEHSTLLRAKTCSRPTRPGLHTTHTHTHTLLSVGKRQLGWCIALRAHQKARGASRPPCASTSMWLPIGTHAHTHTHTHAHTHTQTTHAANVKCKN